MAFAFMQLVGKYEGVMGVTTAEMRVAIILGGIVCAVAVGYEFYRKRPSKTRIDEQAIDNTSDPSETDGDSLHHQ